MMFVSRTGVKNDIKESSITITDCLYVTLKKWLLCSSCGLFGGFHPDMLYQVVIGSRELDESVSNWMMVSCLWEEQMAHFRLNHMCSVTLWIMRWTMEFGTMKILDRNQMTVHQSASKHRSGLSAY